MRHFVKFHQMVQVLLMINNEDDGSICACKIRKAGQKGSTNHVASKWLRLWRTSDSAEGADPILH